MPTINSRGVRVHTPQEVETALSLAREIHQGKRSWPPEIVEKRKQIERATRNAEKFTALMRVVDHGMIHDIIQMKLELDALYSKWIVAETPVTN